MNITFSTWKLTCELIQSVIYSTFYISFSDYQICPYGILRGEKKKVLCRNGWKHECNCHGFIRNLLFLFFLTKINIQSIWLKLNQYCPFHLKMKLLKSFWRFTSFYQSNFDQTHWHSAPLVWNCIMYGKSQCAARISLTKSRITLWKRLTHQHQHVSLALRGDRNDWTRDRTRTCLGLTFTHWQDLWETTWYRLMKNGLMWVMSYYR